MLTKEQFLDAVKDSFKAYLTVKTSRSTAKLKAIHGAIARDLQERFGAEYTVESQGLDEDKENCVEGRYYPKRVDITISRQGKPVAGYAVKFVMRNYSQNSNNYFENMLGETANLRTNGIPYFQIFIIFDQVPYYRADGSFCKWETITEHNLSKYVKLSTDDPGVFYHTPDKTLVVLLSLKEPGVAFNDSAEYADYYLARVTENDLITYSTKIEDVFGSSVILNDYENFAGRTVAIVNGRLK